jgi:hypothetical protein
MSLTTLEDDLLQEIKEERRLIYEQIEVLDPLSVALRKPLPQRLMHNTLLTLGEIVCYLLAIGGIVFTAVAHTFYPFSVLAKIYNSKSLMSKLGTGDVDHLALAVYAVMVLCILLIFLVGRMARDIRKKNQVLHLAGMDVKEMMAAHLDRKAAIDYLEMKHELDFSGASIPEEDDEPGISHIMNPGYEP